MFSVSDSVCAVESHVSSDVAGESVILNMEDGKYYGLNQVGAFIWSLLRKPITVGEIHDELMRRYEVDSETCMRELCSLLESLESRKLITVRPVHVTA